MRSILATCLVGFVLISGMVQAQSQFSPVITVNDSAITGYELDQRVAMLRVFRTPGNLQEVAREQLIEDRLKQEALDQARLAITPEGLQSELEAFAGRANLEYDQFLTVLAQNGVAESTLVDFVRISVSWRDYIRSRFGARAEISDTEVDRALGQSGDSASGIEVLLSEIIIPAPPPQAAQAMVRAERIARLTSTAAFSAEAREVSALPSRNNGGRLGWLPLSNFPPQLRPLFLQLGQGEVTAPIQIPNGVALFQMRGIREVSSSLPAPTAIDYAAFYMGDASEADARVLAARVDACDDLYGVARGLPDEVLERQSRPIGDIPTDIALELARLDAGEVSYSLTRAEGRTRVFLMLCSRSFNEDATADRDAIRAQLRSQRLAGFAAALLADLRAAATING